MESPHNLLMIHTIAVSNFEVMNTASKLFNVTLLAVIPHSSVSTSVLFIGHSHLAPCPPLCNKTWAGISFDRILLVRDTRQGSPDVLEIWKCTQNALSVGFFQFMYFLRAS